MARPRCSLIRLVIWSLNILCSVVRVSSSDNFKFNKVEYFAHKHQPTFAPCKYGVVKAFDQANVAFQAEGDFKNITECCEGCETLHIVLPGTETKAKLCCLPETPYKHGTQTMTRINKETLGSVGDSVRLIHPLSIIFDDIVPKELDINEYRKQNKIIIPSVGKNTWCFILLGAAIGQLIVFILIVFFYKHSEGRIVLETIPDCDFMIEPDTKVLHASKSVSAMMSENMNSDLMSMTQDAM